MSDLALHIVDRDMGDEVRGTRSLSGGERFLVSLALALALSGLEGRSSFVDTLFIDEGFGSLDTDTLDLAVDALETLQGRGQKVGVITHVAAMIERIAVQVRVEKMRRRTLRDPHFYRNGNDVVCDRKLCIGELTQACVRRSRWGDLLTIMNINIVLDVDRRRMLTSYLTQYQQCAVERHRPSAGANPARQLSLQPVAIGAGDGGNDIA